MSTVVFAAPPTSPEAPPPLDAGWDRLEQWFVDRNGRRWELSDWESGIIQMPGVKGLGEHPKVTHQELDFANVDGATWNGLIVEARDCWWPVYLFKDSTSVAYLEWLEQFWDALDPFHTVEWYVRSPSGAERHITVRMTDHGGPGSDYDDVYYGWSKFGISLRAYDPFWKGEVVSARFTAGAPVPFFGPDGDNAPPFRPSRNTVAARATINNPGKVTSPLRWRITGPISAGAELGFGDSKIEVPFAVTGGQVVTIDTAPNDQRTVRDGTDITTLMTGRYDMTPIEPGENLPLALDFAGSGSVEVELTPRHWRGYA